MPLLSSGRSGALVSATSTSPFGRTYSHRGCCRPSANASTFVPAAATGVAPAGHPTAVATFTSGSIDVCGGGSSGCGPTPAESGRCAADAHADRTHPARATVQRFSMQIDLKRSSDQSQARGERPLRAIVYAFRLHSRVMLTLFFALAAAVASADQTFVRAAAAGDGGAVAAVLHQGFTWTDANGRTLNAAHVKQALPKPAIASEATAQMASYDYGDVDVVQVNSGKLHTLRVWVKRPAGWRLLVYQEVKSLDAAAPAAAAPAKSGACEDPCGAVPYTPKTAAEREVMKAYTSAPTATARSTRPHARPRLRRPRSAASGRPGSCRQSSRSSEMPW